MHAVAMEHAMTWSMATVASAMLAMCWMQMVPSVCHRYVQLSMVCLGHMLSQA